MLGYICYENKLKNGRDTVKYTFIFCLFLLLSCGGNLDFSPDLSAEFNICDHWHDGMTWADFQKIRTHLERKSLIRFVDKIQANKMLKEMGIPVIPIIYASNGKEDFVAYINNKKSYVAKASHMSQNNGLIIVEDGIDLVTNKPITPIQVQIRMHNLIDSPSNSDEWILQNIPPGFLIQPYLKKRQEIKIQTIWGKTAEIVWVQGDESMKPNYYDPDGQPLRGGPKLPFSKNLIDEAKKIAERIAKNTDALRVDIMVRYNENGTQDLLVNELELRSALPYARTKEFAELLNQGYRNLCKNSHT